MDWMHLKPVTRNALSGSANAHGHPCHVSPRQFPGDLKTGTLAADEASLERFEEFGNEEVCPALSPSPENASCMARGR